MAEKQKPQEDLVKLAGRAMTNPDTLKGSEIKRMAARILDDQRNAPAANTSKLSLTSKVMAKVGEMLPDAVTGNGSGKAKSAPVKGPVKPAPTPVAAPKSTSKPSVAKPASAPAAKSAPASIAKSAPVKAAAKAASDVKVEATKAASAVKAGVAKATTAVKTEATKAASAVKAVAPAKGKLAPKK